MSAFAALVERDAAGDSSSRRGDAEQAIRTMARAARTRADEPPDARSAARGLVAAVAAAARTAAGERALVAADGDLLVAADAALVRRGALRRALEAAGAAHPAHDGDAALLLAAWRAWGEGMVERVEGDLALVLWDGAARTFVAWRDFVGRRPLHWAVDGDGGLLAGSTPGVILAHPRAPRELDPEALAAASGPLLEHPEETAWRGIRVLPPGHLLRWHPGSAPVVRRVWEPPAFEQGPAASFDEAREELRRLLLDATAERMDRGASTAVWVSGGWDSPAVYGAARASGGAVVPVSMSYPHGDRGREDGTVETIAAFHRDSVQWAHATEAPMVPGDPLAELAAWDEPFAHPYSGWNARLAVVSRAAGARVALDGAGGDQLFAVTPVYLADLLRRGRVGAARREAREHGVVAGAARERLLAWWRWGVRPLLPPAALAAVGLLRGGRVPLGHLERPVPAWLRSHGGRRDGLRLRARGWSPRRGESLGSAESRWYLTSPWSGRILAAQAAVALEQGVVLRSPLLDARIVALAASRPREERAGRGETKRLLRAAVTGWLPEEVLAPRASRSGLSTDYFRRELRMGLPRLLALAGGMEALGGLGVVDPAAMRQAAQDWLAGRAGDEVGLALLCTLRTELWTRLRSGDGRGPASAVTFAAGTASSS